MATDTIGMTGSGADYTDMGTWFSDIPSTLLEAEIGAVVDYSEYTEAGTILSLAARTTTASLDITLKADTGASFKDNASVRTNALRYNASNGAAVRATSGTVISGNVNLHFTVQDLQIKGPGTGNYDSVIYMNGFATTRPIRFLGNIIDGTANTSDYNYANVMVKGQDVVIANNLIVARDGGGVTTRGNADGQWKYIHNTVICPTNLTAADEGLLTDYYGGECANNLIIGFTTDATLNVSATQTGSNNATELTDVASGLIDQATDNNQYSITASSELESATDASGALDARAKSGGACDGNGAYDSTWGVNDISGTARDVSTPTIGCWEIAAAAGASQLAGQFGGQYIGQFGS